MAWVPSVVTVVSLMDRIAPSLASTAAFTPLKSALSPLLEPVFVIVAWVTSTASPETSTAFSLSVEDV